MHTRNGNFSTIWVRTSLYLKMKTVFVSNLWLSNHLYICIKCNNHICLYCYIVDPLRVPLSQIIMRMWCVYFEALWSFSMFKIWYEKFYAGMKLQFVRLLTIDSSYCSIFGCISNLDFLFKKFPCIIKRNDVCFLAVPNSTVQKSPYALLCNFPSQIFKHFIEYTV